MVVMKQWRETDKIGRPYCDCCGWYLFGIIPLYIHRVWLGTFKVRKLA